MINGPECGKEYEADGCYIDGLKKIDGATCVTIKCVDGEIKVEGCINSAAGWIGKKLPYAVKPGEFDGPPKEIRPGEPILRVRGNGE